MRGDRFALQPRSADEQEGQRTPTAMPILIIFLIIVVLIAQIGFWDTFAAILGGVAMVLLFALLLAALVALTAWLAYRRLLGPSGRTDAMTRHSPIPHLVRDLVSGVAPLGRQGPLSAPHQRAPLLRSGDAPLRCARDDKG
jgi:hypothetical protein